MTDIEKIMRLEKELCDVNGKLQNTEEIIAKLKKCIVINNKDLSICIDVIEVMQNTMSAFMQDVCNKTGLDVEEYLDLSGEEDDLSGLNPAEASVELYLEEDLPSVYTEDEIMGEMFPEDDETIF